MGKDRILLCGDAIIDDYIVLEDSGRQSPEADIPIWNTTDGFGVWGGVCGVAVYMAMLWERYSTFCQADPFASPSSNQNRVSCSVKTRYITESGTHLMRVDDDVRLDPPLKGSGEYMSFLRGVQEKKDVGLICISDYAKGFVCDPILSGIRKAHDGVPMFVDYHPGNPPEMWAGAKVIKTSEPVDSDFFAKTLCDYVVTTYGEKGSVIETSSGKKIEVSAFKPEDTGVLDVTGAGDAYMAGMAVGWMNNEHVKDEQERLYKSCRFGAAVASVAVSRIGATPVTTDDLEGVVDRLERLR